MTSYFFPAIRFISVSLPTPGDPMKDAVTPPQQLIAKGVTGVEVTTMSVAGNMTDIPFIPPGRPVYRAGISYCFLLTLEVRSKRAKRQT